MLQCLYPHELWDSVHTLRSKFILSRQVACLLLMHAGKCEACVSFLLPYVLKSLYLCCVHVPQWHSFACLVRVKTRCCQHVAVVSCRGLLQFDFDASP